MAFFELSNLFVHIVMDVMSQFILKFMFGWKGEQIVEANVILFFSMSCTDVWKIIIHHSNVCWI